MYLKTLLGDLTPIVLLSEDNDLYTLIKDSKYLVVKLNPSDLSGDHLDLMDAIENRDETAGWKVIDINSGEVNSFDGEIPEEFITVNEIVVRIK